MWRCKWSSAANHKCPAPNDCYLPKFQWSQIATLGHNTNLKCICAFTMEMATVVDANVSSPSFHLAIRGQVGDSMGIGYVHGVCGQLGSLGGDMEVKGHKSVVSAKIWQYWICVCSVDGSHRPPEKGINTNRTPSRSEPQENKQSGTKETTLADNVDKTQGGTKKTTWNRASQQKHLWEEHSRPIVATSSWIMNINSNKKNNNMETIRRIATITTRGSSSVANSIPKTAKREHAGTLQNTLCLRFSLFGKVLQMGTWGFGFVQQLCDIFWGTRGLALQGVAEMCAEPKQHDTAKKSKEEHKPRALPQKSQYNQHYHQPSKPRPLWRAPFHLPSNEVVDIVKKQQKRRVRQGGALGRPSLNPLNCPPFPWKEMHIPTTSLGLSSPLSHTYTLWQASRQPQNKMRKVRREGLSGCLPPSWPIALKNIKGKSDLHLQTIPTKALDWKHWQ